MTEGKKATALGRTLVETLSLVEPDPRIAVAGLVSAAATITAAMDELAGSQSVGHVTEALTSIYSTLREKGDAPAADA